MGKLNEGSTEFPVEVEQSKTVTATGELKERGTTATPDGDPSRTRVSLWVNFGVIVFFALAGVVVWLMTFGSQ